MERSQTPRTPKAPRKSARPCWPRPASGITARSDSSSSALCQLPDWPENCATAWIIGAASDTWARPSAVSTARITLKSSTVMIEKP